MKDQFYIPDPRRLFDVAPHLRVPRSKHPPSPRCPMFCKNLIPLHHDETPSAPFIIGPNDPPVLVRLITGDESGRLPACAQARILMRNSAGTFSDLAFIGMGRDLSALLTHVGQYQVVAPKPSSERLAFGVDAVSVKFGSPSAPIPMRD